ncbi:galactose-specific lectin nattectin [Lates calcarifer]|nr:galactose-specific lectin nattectin [Lates calcarifer]XP_018543827.1 galactose-specific lectin nattectin [Lates calcarifer]
MKTLAVSALVCALIALTRAAEAEARKDLAVKSLLVKRAASCPPRWSEYNGRCFSYIPRAMTWAKAEKNCLSMNANLASVHNLEEYHEIQRVIMTTSYEYKESWLGGSDAQEEGVWLWSDGSRFDYLNWCPGQPDNRYGGQNCLQMNFGGEKCWDDTACNIRRPFVCAKKI